MKVSSSPPAGQNIESSCSVKISSRPAPLKVWSRPAPPRLNFEAALSLGRPRESPGRGGGAALSLWRPGGGPFPNHLHQTGDPPFRFFSMF